MRLAFLFSLLLIVGCGPKAPMAQLANEAAPFMKSSDLAAMEAEGWEGDAHWVSDEVSEQPSKVGGEKVSANRKIIYTASMEVVVEQFDGVESKLSAFVKKHGGFIASTNLGRMSGEQRSGSWTIRIPVDHYHEFLSAAGDIGVPASRIENASDVTEEFVDVEARIKNKRKLEARILELLDRREDKIQHVIEVERELARVREEIERMEGRMRYLKDKTSLTTITITVREQRDYVPEQAPTFTNRIGNAWNASLSHCQRVFEDCVVFAVRNALGFIAFLLLCVLLLPIFRRIGRRGKQILTAASPKSPGE